MSRAAAFRQPASGWRKPGGPKSTNHCGATEIGAWGYECEEQSGLHVNDALFLVQIEDIETGELITEPSKRGKMVITNLPRTAQPCIRFDSKDLIEWNPESCTCGSTFSLLKGGVQGRADDITKVKGVLLSPTAIEGSGQGDSAAQQRVRGYRDEDGRHR